ncbi:MAG: hypothetical protein ACI9JL_002401 [Paracoccaceae bacterium]|jgi:hypothetical protein
MVAPVVSNADTIRYADGGFGSVQQSLSGLGYNLSDPSIESTAESFIVPGVAGGAPGGASGGSTRLDFTYVRDTGSYRFSFGVFDRGAVTADPVSDRQNWAIQALGASTVVFDDRVTNPGATASVEFAAGTDLGLFLIPNDTLASVLENPAAFYGGSRPAPLFSVADANPGSFDQLMTFEAGGLTTFAFEDLSRAGYSDQDFTDLVITMTADPLPGQFLVQTEAASTAIAEPRGLAILMLAGLSLVWLRARRRT